MSEVSVKKTELITFGYTREAESILNDSTIPSAVTNVVLLFIENYYYNYGEYVWKIDD